MNINDPSQCRAVDQGTLKDSELRQISETMENPTNKLGYEKLPFLSIAIPTYNRREAILARIETLLSLPKDQLIEVLVLDNGSEDGTYQEALRVTKPHSEVFRVLSRDKNLGYAANFTRSIEEARGEYVLVTSDEDDIQIEEIRRYINFLQDVRPSFISPQAIVHNKIYRGKRVRRKIAPHELRKSASYVSGLTFNRASSIPIIERLKELTSSNLQAQLYPQVLLAAHHISRREGYWYNRPITVQKTSLETFISDTIGRKHYHLASRWDQHKAALDYFEEAISHSDQNQANLIKKMIDAENEALFDRLCGAIAHERPELAKWVKRRNVTRALLYRIKLLYWQASARLAATINRI